MNLSSLHSLNHVLQSALQRTDVDDIDEALSKMRFELWALRDREHKRELAKIRMEIYGKIGFKPTLDSATVKELE